jgi:hypothetical protein
VLHKLKGSGGCFEAGAGERSGGGKRRRCHERGRREVLRFCAVRWMMNQDETLEMESLTGIYNRC